MTNRPGITGRFGEHIAAYADAIAANFRQQVDAAPEDQLKAPVGELVKAMGRTAGKAVDYRTEVRVDDVEGRPDLGVTLDGLLIGLIELKAPGVGARPETFTGRNAEQWKRFKEFPNLIYTDGAQWSLYQNGERKSRLSISDDIRDGGARSLVSRERQSLEMLLVSFLEWGPTAPATAEGLAAYLAPLTRILRDEVLRSLAQGGSPLRALAAEWAGLLFPEGEDAQFADAYAQTVTYALLLAQFEGAEQLRPAFASEALGREHGLLAEALRLLEADSVRDELRMPIELLERAIHAVDTPRLNQLGDPWIYFYEHFLGAYDPKLRKDRGVYFTPVEVVQAQVRLSGELLRTRFQKPLAFADNDVVVLDPAVGTGTYPLAVLDHAAEAVREGLGPGAVAGKLRSLADRLYAFEILVGPYSVAHLRLSQRLRAAGVDDRSPRVYLTDTLESPNQFPAFTSSLLNAQLTEERKRALEVKKNTHVFVCLGNPPYDRDLRNPDDGGGGQRKGGWVRYGDTGEGATPAILKDFVEPVREAGDGGDLKPLYNDYVYFWRWALWKVFDSTEDAGIVTFITASSYLRGPGFAGMRRKMREVFDELWIIDLEGGQRGTRTTENVFAIQIPVAIAIGVRNEQPKPDEPATVWKTRLAGSEQAKRVTLGSTESFTDFQWSECAREWNAPFHPIGTGAYFTWPRITDAFPWQHSGAVLYRTWPIGQTEAVLTERWRNLLETSEDRRSRWFRETRDRKIVHQYPSLTDQRHREPPVASLTVGDPVPPIVPYAYRSFDRQWVIADSRVGDYMRPELWRAHGPHQVYLVGMLVQVLGAGPAAMAADAIPDLHHFRGSFGDKGVIPLWRNAGATEPNVTGGLLALLSEIYGGDVSPERLFAYAYGILAQPAYVERFWDELEQPPPRLPLTKEAALFERAADLGSRLLSLHTYGERYGGNVPRGEARCTRGVSLNKYPQGHGYDSVKRSLVVGDGEFAPVSKEVWDYSVSGMQIVKSWLDRRKRERSGKKSSPLDAIGPERWEFTEQLLELLWVLEETVRLQPEGTKLLEDVCAGPLFTAAELPAPSEAERRAPVAPGPGERTLFEE